MHRRFLPCLLLGLYPLPDGIQGLAAKALLEHLLQGLLRITAPEIDRTGIHARRNGDTELLHQGKPNARGTKLLQIGIGMESALHDEPELRPLRQRFGQFHQLLLLRRRHRGLARLKGHLAESFLCTSGNQGRQGPEGARRDPGDHVHEGRPDQRSEAELRGVQISFHREPQVDHPAGVLEQCDGQVEGQAHRLRALHSLPESQTLHHDSMVAVESAFVDLVLQVQRQLAGIDFAAGEITRIRGERGHLHVAEHHAQVGKAPRIHRVKLALDVGRAVFVDPAVEVDPGSRTPFRGDPGHVAFHFVDPGAERQDEAQVGEIDPAVVDKHAANPERKGIGRGRGCRWFRLFRLGRALEHLGQVQGSVLVDDEPADRARHAQIPDLQTVGLYLQLEAVGSDRLPAEQRLGLGGLGETQVVQREAALIGRLRPRGFDPVTQGPVGGERTRVEDHGGRSAHVRLEYGQAELRNLDLALQGRHLRIERAGSLHLAPLPDLEVRLERRRVPAVHRMQNYGDVLDMHDGSVLLHGKIRKRGSKTGKGDGLHPKLKRMSCSGRRFARLAHRLARRSGKQHRKVQGAVRCQPQIDIASTHGDSFCSQDVRLKIIGAALQADPVDPESRLRLARKAGPEAVQVHADVRHPNPGLPPAGFGLGPEPYTQFPEAGPESRWPALVQVFQSDSGEIQIVQHHLPGSSCRFGPVLRRAGGWVGSGTRHDALQVERSLLVHCKTGTAAVDNETPDLDPSLGQVKPAVDQPGFGQFNQGFLGSRQREHKPAQCKGKTAQNHLRHLAAEIHMVVGSDGQSPGRRFELQGIAGELPEGPNVKVLEGKVAFQCERIDSDRSRPPEGLSIGRHGRHGFRPFAPDDGSEIIDLEVQRLQGENRRFDLPPVGKGDLSLFDHHLLEDHSRRRSLPDLRRRCFRGRRQIHQVQAAVLVDDGMDCRSLESHLAEGPCPLE